MNDLTPARLTRLLKVSPGRVIAVAQRREVTMTAEAAYLSLTYSADAPADAPRDLFLKIGARPGEVAFYQRIAPLMIDPPVLPCYHAEWDRDRSRLLFPDMSATHRQAGDLPPTPGLLRRFIDAIVAVHAQWWERALPVPGEDTLGFVIGVAREAYPAFARALGEDLSAARRRVYERVLAAWPPRDLQERIAMRRMTTLVHGDTHPWNFLVPRQTGRDYLIDWAVWRVGVGADDIAYLLTQCPPAECEAQARYYHAQLTARGVAGYDWAQCWRDFRASAIINLVWAVFHWKFGLPPEIWRENMVHALATYDDLRCGELLD